MLLQSQITIIHDDKSDNHDHDGITSSNDALAKRVRESDGGVHETFLETKLELYQKIMHVLQKNTREKI